MGHMLEVVAYVRPDFTVAYNRLSALCHMDHKYRIEAADLAQIMSEIRCY